MSVPNNNLGKWRSIEFECIFKGDANYDSYGEGPKNGKCGEDRLAEFEDWVRTKEYRNLITVKDDGSLSEDGDDDIAKEIVVSYCSGISENIVREVCRFLKTRAYVNNSCGTHVHFDMRHVPAEVARVYGAKLACVIPVLKSILPRSRRNNEFCQENYSDFDGDRYAFVNLTAYSKYKTIEVRGHSGTLNATKILNWIAICEKVMFSNEIKASKDVKEFINDYKLRKRLATFMEKRHEQVNAPARRRTSRAQTETTQVLSRVSRARIRSY